MEASDETVPDSVLQNNYEYNYAEITKTLERSKKPVVVAGLTSARHKLNKEITAFCERNNLPLIVTPMAKNVMEWDNPLFGGVLFHALSDYLDDIVNECDLVIALGYDEVEFNYESWIPSGVPVVHFDTRPADRSETGLFCSFTGTTEQWFGILDKCNFSKQGENNNTLASAKNEMSEVFKGFSNRFGTVAVMDTLMQELPSGAIVTADVGSHLHVAGQYWKRIRNSDFLITNGWSSMGFGIPAALAAQICHPGKSVVAITGDGGFLMMAGEIIAARRYNLPVIIVVLADRELNLIKLKQAWKEKPAYATDLHNGELFGADRFLGARVYNADNRTAFVKAIINALSIGEPSIINVEIDPEEYKWLIVKR
jgi:acetolactate synthase-1/2/3 large subunit